MKQSGSMFSALRYFAVAAILLLAGQVHAAPNPLLNIQTGYPDIFFRSSGGQGASYSGGVLTLNSQPLTLTYTSGGTPSFISGGVFSISLNIAADGSFSGGSFTMTGIVDTFGSPLLTGTVTAYGIADLSTASGGTDRLELLMTASGGSLLSAMGGSGAQIGAIIGLEGSTYSDSFATDWVAGVVKGNVGPVPVPGGIGAGTIGYWKTHPEAWPVGSVTLGNTVYSQAEAIAILGMAVKGDKSISLAKQLIAAKLNVAAGTTASCITSTITAADTWLVNHGGVGSGVKQWDGGDVYHDELDAYNNGHLCAPHRG